MNVLVASDNVTALQCEYEVQRRALLLFSAQQ
jgi:hypothetical protein